MADAETIFESPEILLILHGAPPLARRSVLLALPLQPAFVGRVGIDAAVTSL